MPTNLALRGTAAQGLALSAAAVSVKCATGSASTTTAADGAYSVVVASGSLPCAVEVTGSAGSPVYRSAVAGAGSGPFTVNLSPLTELVVAQAGGVSPATLFGEFATRNTAITAASLASGVSYVQTALRSVVDLTGTNPLSDVLVAANGSTAGNALDAKIDAVVARLATAQTTLEDVVSAAVANPGAPDALTVVVQTAAADCSRLKSGKYRMINPAETDPLWRAHVATLDATALTLTTFDGDVIALVSDGAGLCSYTVTSSDGNGAVDGIHKVVVASSGILVVHSTAVPAGVSALTIGLPEQSLALSELAGSYGNITLGTDGAPASAAQVRYGLGALDATGHDLGGSDCVDLLPCTAYLPPYDTVAPDAANGGFILTQSDGAKIRLFAFKGSNGTIAAIAIDTVATNPSFVVFTSAKRQTLPTLALTIRSWNIQVNANHAVPALVENTHVYNSVDAATRVVTRTRDDGLVDTMTYDTPRDGFRYRANNSCTKNGAAQNCAGLIQMPLQGLGITVFGTLSASPSPFVGFGVVRPWLALRRTRRRPSGRRS